MVWRPRCHPRRDCGLSTGGKAIAAPNALSSRTAAVQPHALRGHRSCTLGSADTRTLLWRSCGCLVRSMQESGLTTTAAADFELQSEVASKLSADAALTVELHMEKLRELRDEARERGQLSAAIKAECLRGELRGFYVKQIATGGAGEFDRMRDEELRAFIYGNEKPAKSKH
jgi:hypothetical protein